MQHELANGDHIEIKKLPTFLEVIGVSWQGSRCLQIRAEYFMLILQVKTPSRWYESIAQAGEVLEKHYSGAPFLLLNACLQQKKKKR